MADETKKPRAAPRAKAAHDLDRLKRLAGEIEGTRHNRLTDLCQRLESEEGMKLADKGGATHVTLAGLKASSTAGLHGALSNWANAARREALQGAA